MDLWSNIIAMELPSPHIPSLFWLRTLFKLVKIKKQWTNHYKTTCYYFVPHLVFFCLKNAIKTQESDEGRFLKTEATKFGTN